MCKYTTVNFSNKLAHGKIINQCYENMYLPIVFICCIQKSSKKKAIISHRLVLLGNDTQFYEDILY